MSTGMGSTTTLSWAVSDPEQRLAFRGGRFTSVNFRCSALIALILTVGFFSALLPFKDSYVSVTFTQRGPVPYLIVALFFWSAAILLLKFLKFRLQRRTLKIAIVPDDSEFVLSPTTVEDIYRLMYRAVDDPKHFLLFNRISIALSNLKNLGRVTDVDEILHTQASLDESAIETSYSLLGGFVWAIPVLGFIGTVQGLSAAIGGFGNVLSASADLSQLKDALTIVTAGLGVAFETTMQGLVAALLIQLSLTALKKSEEEFLDACSEYCMRNIVGRLRLMPFESEGPSQ